MNLLEILDLLAGKNIEIGVVDRGLKVLDPCGNLDQETLQVLRAHKRSLIDFVAEVRSRRGPVQVTNQLLTKNMCKKAAKLSSAYNAETSN